MIIAITYKIPNRRHSYLSIYLQEFEPERRYLIMHTYKTKCHVIYGNLTLNQAKKIVKSFGAKKI